VALGHEVRHLSGSASNRLAAAQLPASGFGSV